MEPDMLPAWAEEHAASWLAERGARWDYVRGVARQAQRVSSALDEDDRPYLVAASEHRVQRICELQVPAVTKELFDDLLSST